MAAGKVIFLSNFCVIYLFFCVPSVTSEENLSLKKAAWQSTTSSHKWTANNVIDGCLNQRVSSGCCSHTDSGKIQAWWQVDLGIRSTISYITIYYRGCPRQKYGYGDCNEMCPDGCYQGTCDASSGSCLYCPPGKWGVVCDMDCHSNCNGGCNVNNGSCAGSTEQCIPREELTVVTVLGTIAGLCLITAIVLFVLLLRSRSILRKEREKDAQYEGIDLSGRIAPNIYESATSTISTN